MTNKELILKLLNLPLDLKVVTRDHTESLNDVEEVGIIKITEKYDIWEKYKSYYELEDGERDNIKMVDAIEIDVL